MLTSWNHDRPQGPIVELAMSSVALAIFSRTQHYPPADIEAGSRYQQLLKAARGTFSALSAANIDDCLLSTFFMSRYEDSFQHPGRLRLGTLTPHRPPDGLNPHKDGSMAILKYWRDNLYADCPPTNTIKQTRRGLLRFAARDHLEVPEWMMDGEVFGEYGLELEYDRILVRITSLRRRLHFILREASIRQRDARELGCPAMQQQLNEEARDLDEMLQDWTSHFPSSWNYRQHVLIRESDPCLEKHFYSSTIYVCSSPSYAAIWTKYFATRMLGIHTHLQLLDAIGGATHQQRAECLSNLERAARSLAYIVPSCLGIVAANSGDGLHDPQTGDPVTMAVVGQEVKPHLARRLSWNLCLASSLEYVDIPLRRWFLAELQYLGKLSGVKLFEQADIEQ